MRVKFYIYDHNNISAGKQIEIQFKSYYHDVYQIQKVENVTKFDPRIYEVVFTFPNQNFIYYSFRNAKTYQSGEQKTVSLSSFAKCGEEIILFVEMKLEIPQYGGYTQINGTYYSGYHYYNRESNNYLVNFIQPNTDCDLYKKLLAYIGTLSFSFHMDKATLIKNICTQIISKTLPNKIDGKDPKVGDIFEFLQAIEEDTKRSEAYIICQTLSKVQKKCNDINYVNQANSLMNNYQRYFKLTDWLKELNSTPVTSYSILEITEVISSKIKDNRLDSETNLIMDELIKIKQNYYNIDQVKADIIKRCYDDQLSDILKMRFLFKYSNCLLQHITQDKIKEEFISLLNKKRQKYLHKDLLKEIAQNARIFIKQFDQYGEIFFSNITTKIFQKELYENEQIAVFEALQENNLETVYPWKKILLEAIRSHKSLDDVQRIVQIITKINPHSFILEIIKKYYTDRIHLFYVSIFEKMQMKAALVELVKKQYALQQCTQQLFQEYDSQEEEEEEELTFSDYGMNSYHYLDDWPNDAYSGDIDFQDTKEKTSKYSKNRGNRQTTYQYEPKPKVKKEPIFKEKVLTLEEVNQFEALASEQLHETFKRFKSTELIKDAKSYNQKDEEIIYELLILLQNHFGQYMAEEWNHYSNFKDKYEGLKKLAEEKTFRREIALIVMKKYTQSAIEYYNSQKKKFPNHFVAKNLLDFMQEAFWLEETNEFRELYLQEFNSFIQGHQQISISTLKSFLTNKETPRVFLIIKQDFFSFKELCSNVIEIFDTKLDQIGQLFKNFKDHFKKQQEVFQREFNIEQKSGNILTLINKFEDINMFTEFNYQLKNSDIYQSIKRFILHIGQFKNEYEVFAALKHNILFFIRFILQNNDLQVDKFQKYDFEEIAHQIRLAAILQKQQEEEKKREYQRLLEIALAMEQEEQVRLNSLLQNLNQQQNAEQNNQQQQQQGEQQQQAEQQQEQQQQQQQVNDLNAQQQNQQQQNQQQAEQNQPQVQDNQMVEENQNNEAGSREEIEDEEQNQNQEEAKQQQQDQEKKDQEVEQPKILVTMDFSEKLSIIDLKNHTGSTYDKSIENINKLKEMLGITINTYSLEKKLYNIYTLDFFKVYLNEVLDILRQYGIDINDPQHASINQQLTFFQNIQNFNSISIWELENNHFQDLYDCFKPVTNFNPKLVEILRRCEDIVQFAYDNFTGEEGRGFLDLNDIIDDQDADISSLIIKLNQLTPFINQLVSIRKNSIENKDSQDAKQIILSIFDTINNHLQKEDDQINLEDSINNFFKIKNMSLNFDKKKSYIILSQQIVSEGKMKIQFDEAQKSIGVQVILEDKLYQEDEINQICSKVIIEQNTTNIIIAQARRALAQKNKNTAKIQKQNQVEEEEETIPDQKENMEVEQDDENSNDQDQHDQEQEILLMESAAIKQKIEQFKDMWMKIGDLKSLMNEINLLGYFDIHQMKLEYINSDNQIENNFEKMNQDKRNFQTLLKNWRVQIRDCCKQYPLFSLLGHNLYTDMFQLITQQKKLNEISSDLQDILHLEMFSKQFMKLQTNNVSSTEEANTQRLEQEIEVSNNLSAHDKLVNIYFEQKQIIILIKKASWFAESKSSDEIQIEKQNKSEEVEEKVEAIIYSGNKELVDVIFKILDKQNKDESQFEFYQYIYCDVLTQIQDFYLFIHRLTYLIQNKPKLYIIVLNNKLEASFTLRAIEAIQKVNKSKASLYNNLIILARREFYSEIISNVNQISVEDFLLKYKQDEQIEIKDKNEMDIPEQDKYKTTFFTSQLPGAGKSFQIQKIFSSEEIKQNNVRIAINGTGSKKDLIELFRQRLSSCKKNSPINIHIDIYPYDQYDLNMLLFELIAFRSLSIHQKSFIDIGQQVFFYIEINNTLKNDLQESLFIKDHFKNVNVKFNIEDYNPIVDIIGYKNYSYAAIVCHYLENILFSETEKNVFDKYQPLEDQQAQENNQEGQEEGENEGEENENQEQAEGQEQEDGDENDDDDDDDDAGDDEDNDNEEEEENNNIEEEHKEEGDNSQAQQDHPEGLQDNAGSNLNNNEQVENIINNTEAEQIQVEQLNPINQIEVRVEQNSEQIVDQVIRNEEQPNISHQDNQDIDSPKLQNQIFQNQEINQNIEIPSNQLNLEQEEEQEKQIINEVEIQQNSQQIQREPVIQYQQEQSQEQQEQQQISNLEAVRQLSQEQQQQEQSQQEMSQNLQEQQEQQEEMVNENNQEPQDNNQNHQPVEQEINQADYMDESFFDYTIFEKVEYKVDNLEFFQELLRKQFVDKLIAQNIEPCFHQLTNFINLFGSEMQKFEKCFFLEKHILFELEPQLLQGGLRTKIVELSLQLSFLVSTNQQRPIAIPIDPQNRNRREYILNEKAQKIQRFSELMTSFVTFQEQENPCLTSFFPSAAQVPRCISNLYSIQGHMADLIYFDQNIPQPKLLKWLNMLINKNGDTISEEVENKVERLAIQRDNFFKIAMIFMRIRALSPIVLMGEAGTGKTALIELLSALMDAKFYTLNIHAGITENEVINYINQAINSIEKENQKVIVFFDEMNTNKLVEGIFKEIIVDRCLKGSKLPDNFIPITAINPYKIKSKEQKQMFNLQVHGGIKREVMSRMNNTDLEYMVEPLPESLYSFIWNIDHLSNEEEDSYIIKIVQYKNQLREQKNKPYFNNDQFRRIINSLSQSQKYLRKIMGCQSACSLRDIARFTKLLFWFQGLLLKSVPLGLVLFSLQECAITLALYVNYCVRIPLQQQRKDYLKYIFNPDHAKEDVEAVQTFLSNQIEVPKGIVKNTAFKQNTLTLFASIMNKIPVILIGQPGCTKTLSLRLLIQSLRGDQSKSELFKSLKTLVPIYYQGHVQSTSERIMDVFTNANKKQQKIEADNQQKRYLSLVYLEEIGLAEISPHNPLKVLHQTLEKPKVAVACISNWPLDQSKMNRMLSVYRLDTSKDELIETVQCIYEELITFEKDEYLREALQTIQLTPEFAKWSVKIYTEYNKFLKRKLPEHEQFHGLRDFYGMAKLLCSKYLDYVLEEIFKHVDKNNTIVLKSINIKDLVEINQKSVKGLIIQSFLRHFSGLREAYKYLEESINLSLNQRSKEEKEKLLKELKQLKQLKELKLQQQQSSQQQQEQQVEQEQQQQDVAEELEEEQEQQQQEQQQLEQIEQEEIPMTKLEMKQKESSFMEIEKEEQEKIDINELKMIDENLSEKSKYFLSRNLMIITQNTQKALEYITNKITSMNQPVKVFLGSDFPEDKKSETSYQIINEIISCIESGVFVVLQNLDNVYQSLYELLNQNYHYYNGKYFCRVSLGADTSNVEVSTNFKIILIANHIQIPCLSGPLLNRFEKHIFEQSMILDTNDQKQIQEIENHFTDKQSQSASSHILSCQNISQIIESVYLQQKNENEANESQTDLRAILLKLYHMAPFKRVLFYSKEDQLLNNYINSCLHFGINDFLENRIIRQQVANNDIKQFCIFSSSSFSSASIKLKFGDKCISQSVIYLAEITSQVNLSEKLKDFFGGVKETNNEGNIIDAIDILRVEEGQQNTLRSNFCEENSYPSTQPVSILFVACDMEEDSIERIIFTKQKISEYSSSSKDKIVIMTVKVTENFMMIPLSNHWEHYFIDELIPLQNVNCAEMKAQMNLQHLLANKSTNFLDYFRIEPLVQSFLKSSENISISYRKVRYQQDVMNYKTNRLSQLKSILLNLNHCENLTKLNFLLSQIVQIKLCYLLHSLGIKTIEDFIEKQVFTKGFIYQASSILKAIISGLEDLMQQSLCFFIELLEKQQIVFSLSQKLSDKVLFNILMNRIVKSLDIQTENDYTIQQFEQLKSQIDIYPNTKFITRGVQLISVSSDLLFPLEQSKILSPLIQIIQKQIQIYSNEKQNLIQVVERVIQQVQDLFSASEIQSMIQYESFFTKDYYMTRSSEFGQSHTKILQEILKSTYNLSQLDSLKQLLIPILGFEKYHKQIIKAQAFIDSFETELSFKFKQEQFTHFILNNMPQKEADQKDEIILFNFFIIGEIFQFLYENLTVISKKSQLTQYFTKLLKYVDTSDIVQYRFAVLDRIIQISKMIIQFSQEIFDNTQRNYDIFKEINFEEIRDLNFAYIQELREQICNKLILESEDGDQNSIYSQQYIQQLMESEKSAEKKDQIFKNIENQIFQKREKKLIQFEKSWCKFITSVILSNVNEISIENEPINSKLLKFIVDLEISMTTQKSENIQQIFNVIVSEAFGHVKYDQFNQLYTSESEQPCLSNNDEYHTEHFSLVILSQLFQENIIRPAFNSPQGFPLIDIVLFEQFDQLTILQKVIYFSIFREIVYQIFKNNFANLGKIYPTTEESTKIIFQISNFIKKQKSKPFQLYILKQLYQLCKSDMSNIIKDSSFLQAEWITDFTRSFKRLSETEFLKQSDREVFKKYFDQYTPLSKSVRDLIFGEIRFIKNVFRDIYDGMLQMKYYPFMMYNNIQILFDRDPKNNNQLYQCQKCQEYIFSDQCPDLQSKHKCLQCGSMIALNNQNTKRVLQNACQNIAELHKIINEDQWKGYYLILQDDKPDFKLNEGTSYDLRLMSLIYNTIFLLSKTKNFRYFFEAKESLTDWNNNIQEITVSELNKNLKIHYEANAEVHLQDQIDISIHHIKDYLTKIHKAKDDDIPIILFKFIYALIFENEIKSCDTVQERTQLNVKISELTKSIYEDLSRLSQVEQSFSKKILEQQENLNLEVNYKRNLRYFDTEYKLESLYIQINEQIPNNEFQVLKKLLNFKEVNQISRILKVFAKFYKYMNREFSNKYSLTKAQDISFAKGLKNNEENPLYQYYVQEFLPAWNEFREREKHFQIECEQIEIPQFDLNTKINFLVYGEQKNLGSLANGLELVCQLQNNYIHHIYQLSVIDSNENKVDSKITQQVKNLFENSEDTKNLKQKPLDQINPSIHLLKSYDELIIKNYVFSNLEYGNGKKYIFDLEQLQQRLVKDVLTGAVIIDLEKTVKFKYLNEVHQIGLLSNNLIPQETIFFEIRSKIQKFFTNKEQAFEFLQQLSTIFQMFKAESLQAELSIKSALDILQLKLKQENMKEILSEQLKLKHLNDLICCIEEIQIDNLVELCNPFYKQPIVLEAAQRAVDFIKSNEINIDDFLVALGRFTIRCLSSDASSISPSANLFEQIFYTDIYSELWRDPSKLDKLYKDAVEIPVLIGQSYGLFQFVQKQKNTQEINTRDIDKIKEENIQNIIL